MNRRTSRKLMVRALAVAALAFGLAGGVALTGPAVRQVRAQAELPAVVVRGDCGAPGDVAADLRPLTASEGGVLTSFSTIDLAIGELTGGGYAVVVGAVDAPAACGDLTGAGADVYVAVAETNASGLGGIAWLHARGERTQVSLFVGEGLGGAAGPTPTEDPNAPPEPPAEETPEPTPASNDDGNALPSYEIAIAYDAAQWQVASKTTEPGTDGPVDQMVLINNRGTARAEFVAFPMPRPILVPQYLDYLVTQLEANPNLHNVTIRTDAAGNSVRGGDSTHGFLVVNLTMTNGTIVLSYHIEAWQVPAVDGFLVMIYEVPVDAYEGDAPQRESLVNGVVLPQ